MNIQIITLIVLCLAKDVFSANENVLRELGGKVVLTQDSVTNPPSSILWRLEKNKVADFDKDFGTTVTYYGNFDGRTTLDTTTGVLTITGLRKTDEGRYSVEFNSKPLEKTFTLSVLKPVPKPTIKVSCDDNKISCTLTCDGDTAGAEPVTYSWIVGEGNWEKIGKLLIITKSDSKHGYKYTCKLNNSVSEQVSYSVKELFGPESSWRISSVTIILLSTIVILGIGLTLFLVRKKTRGYRNNSLTEILHQPCVFCHCTAKDSE